MGDRSTVNIITEIHDRMNIGINVNLHWGGSNAQYDALETLRSYNYNRRCDEAVSYTHLTLPTNREV